MIGPYTQAGIEYARQGRRYEALPYLRYALAHETAHAELWLWLAHVTPDIQEYRHCVAQALLLQPDHPTALRMQTDLNYQKTGMSPPVMAAPVLQQMEKRSKQQKRWRRWLIFLIVILLAVSCGLLARQELNQVSSDNLLKWLALVEENKQLRFAVGSEEEAIGFEVTVPESWFLADKGSPSWREKRETLEQEFPDFVTGWRDLETDLGEVTFNSDNTLSETVSIVETDSLQIESVLPDVPRLELVELRPLEQAEDTCESLRQIAAEELPQLSQQSGFVEAEVKQRDADGCIYLVHTRDSKTHQMDIVVPVTETRAAVWQVQIPAAVYDAYENIVTLIVDTLKAR